MESVAFSEEDFLDYLRYKQTNNEGQNVAKNVQTLSDKELINLAIEKGSFRLDGPKRRGLLRSLTSKCSGSPTKPNALDQAEVLATSSQTTQTCTSTSQSDLASLLQTGLSPISRFDFAPVSYPSTGSATTFQTGLAPVTQLVFASTSSQTENFESSNSNSPNLKTPKNQEFWMEMGASINFFFKTSKTLFMLICKSIG